MTNKDNKMFKHLSKCISKIDKFWEMTILPSMYPKFIAPFVPYRNVISNCIYDCSIQTDGSLNIMLIEFVSFFDDYDSVERALFNHFDVDEDE